MGGPQTLRHCTQHFVYVFLEKGLKFVSDSQGDLSLPTNHQEFFHGLGCWASPWPAQASDSDSDSICI